ncbi:MAG: hypothetical protein AABX34_04960 [Nanoarchaeota archaeon]
MITIIIISSCASKETDTKITITQPTETGKTLQDPSQLNGLWKIETAYILDNPPGIWKEDKVTAMRIPYQEFKDGKMCRAWSYKKPEITSLEEAFENYYCGEYKSYIVNGATITFEGETYGPAYQWNIVDGKLELGMPAGKGIYVKTSGTREKPADITEPKITSFTLSSTSVKVGEQVTLTCSASDDESICELNIYVNSPQSNAFQGGGGFLQSGTRTFDYTVHLVGTYSAECKVVDCAKHEVSKILTLSAS